MDDYRPLHRATAVNTLHAELKRFTFDDSADEGLRIVPPEGFEEGPKSTLDPRWTTVSMPKGLRNFLEGLRLLEHVPLAYLVPDPALLPPESIRFFHVDRTWTDRLVDGALSAVGAGTLGMVLHAASLSWIRRDLDIMVNTRAWGVEGSKRWHVAEDPMTGMLIRSELVERWPDLTIKPEVGGKPMAVLRQDALSSSIMIALFAGQPSRVRICEPEVALRFGVEEQPEAPVPYRSQSRRVLNIHQLAATIGGQGGASPREIAIHLQQRSYAQVFSNGTNEERGSVAPQPLALRGGFVIQLAQMFEGREVELARARAEEEA